MLALEQQKEEEQRLQLLASQQTAANKQHLIDSLARVMSHGLYG